jgi:hypothetical protein
MVPARLGLEAERRGKIHRQDREGETMSASNSATLTKAEHAASMELYSEKGLELAKEIGNHGPVRFDSSGKLAEEILNAYWQQGFYIFEGVVDPAEIDELRNGVNDMLERAPVAPGARVDAQGRPALGSDYEKPPFLFSKPLADPWGGTQLLGGRHPTKMTQPTPDADAPERVVFLLSSICQAMPAGLRLYGHPDLLSIAESINGQDFVPYTETIFIKQPGLGGSVSWHQDGVTHWDSPDWDEGIHGFNFQIQLYPTTPANCLWVVPGTHKLGRIDIKERVAENGGSDQLPGALPLVCDAGDVTVVNRQLLHGSFANSSPDLRVSLTYGFHRRKSVEGQKAALGVEGSGVVYDEQRIFERSSVIALAINARRAHFPGARTYEYKPFAGLENDYPFNDETCERVLRDYATKDLAI